MKRILINATHNEEVRVALCKGNHLYDFDLENRTREQKKANIYKGHVTRVEPSLEAVFVEYGSKRQGFLPVREIASEYLSGNPREENIRKLIKEGDELIVQVEKEERGNKGAALSTYVSLAGRYLVLMPNNPKGGGISRQISGKLREDMKRMLGNLELPKGMSVIVRTAGIGKTQEDLQHDLNHLLNIWNAIQDQNKKYPSPRLVHQEAGVVTRAVRDYLRDDISEIWIDNEEAYIEAETFVKAVMPKQVDKLRKYTDFEPMFTSFNVERQIETAYQREVRLPSGGSIVIDQTEALVSIDINSAKSTKGSDVAETAYHTNLEAADEIARQLRLRDMGGLIVIDFIDMNDNKNQKEVEKRLVEATKYDRARVQFGEISRFGLMEMSRQRLRPSLEESTGYICPRCHGNGMIRDLRSLSLSIMRQIEQTALKERHGEVQAEVPTDIAAFLLNEKRESLVYLEQDSGTRITILPHAHLESPNFNIHFNHHGFAPASYERVTDTLQQETSGLGYDVDWQTSESERPEQQPTRQPRQKTSDYDSSSYKQQSKFDANSNTSTGSNLPLNNGSNHSAQAEIKQNQPAAVAWLSNLFAPTPQAQMSASVSSADAAQAIESIVNSGAESRGAFGNISASALSTTDTTTQETTTAKTNGDKEETSDNKDRRRSRSRGRSKNDKRYDRSKSDSRRRSHDKSSSKKTNDNDQKSDNRSNKNGNSSNDSNKNELPKREPNSKRESRGPIERGETKQLQKSAKHADDNNGNKSVENKSQPSQSDVNLDPNEVNLRVTEAENTLKEVEVVHISLDGSKPETSKTEKLNQQEAQSSEAEVNATKEVSDQKAGDTADGSDNSTDSKDKPLENKDAKESASQDNQVVNPEAEQVQDSQADDAESKSDTASLTFDVDSLFADRYVAAKKFGQAANDPRVIKASFQKPKTEKEPTETNVPATAIISGTVGQFIHTHLAQPTMRLAKDGVITCFLAALNAHKETSGMPVKPARKTRAKKSPKPQSFSFVNYGYQSLSPSYLERFEKMTSAVAEHSVEQGKTETKPTTIGRRAANDPRGQHPDYTPIVEENSQSVESTPDNNESVATVSQEAVGQSATDVMNSLLKLNVGEFVYSVLGEEGKTLLDANKTESAFLKALSQPVDVFLKAARSIGAPSSEIVDVSVASDVSEGASLQLDAESSAEQPADALTGEPEAQTVSDDSQEVLEHIADSPNVSNEHESSEHENTQSEQDQLEQNQEAISLDEQNDQDEESNSNKTSIESYKSMIESISEQLLPQTGILNLSTPKVPKSRSRKVKEETSTEAETETKSETDSNLIDE